MSSINQPATSGSRIVIPRRVVDEAGTPQPVHYRHVTIVEGMDPDGDYWINIVHDGVPLEDMKAILRMASDTFPAQRVGYDSGWDGA